MSEDTKKNMEQFKRLFETIQESSKQAGEKTLKLDKDLSKKIQKVEEASKEVVKHVEKKSG